jgi:hypothetical protein
VAVVAIGQATEADGAMLMTAGESSDSSLQGDGRMANRKTLNILALSGLLASMSAAGALAQVVTTIPPAPPALPEFVPPPPPPPPAPPAPAEPPVTPPDLVKRVDGQVANLSMPAEFAAALALPLNAEASGKLQAFMADRGAKVDALIVASPAQAAQFWTMLANVQSLELGGMSAFPQMGQAFSVKPPPMDALTASGVLSGAQIDAVRSSQTAYRQAISEDVKAEAGTDVSKLVLLASRRQAKLSNMEFIEAMNRMLDAAAADWSNIATVVAWPNEGELMAAMSGSDAAAKRSALVAALSKIEPELGTKLLSKYARTAPAK